MATASRIYLARADGSLVDLDRGENWPFPKTPEQALAETQPAASVRVDHVDT